MIASYYAPESESGLEIRGKHCWPNAFHSIQPADGVTIKLQTSPRDRVAIDALYIELARSDRFRLTDATLSMTSPGVSNPIILKLDEFRYGSEKVSATSELQGPGRFMASVADPSERVRPDTVTVHLPVFELNGSRVVLAPVRYHLVRTPVLAAPECP